MRPVEVGLPSPRRLQFNKISNEEIKRCEPDFLDEMREASQAKLTIYQRKMIPYYNRKIKRKSFRRGDLVLRRVSLSSKEPRVGKLGPNWEDPYHIAGEVRPGTFTIENLDEKMRPHSWNVEHIRMYYQ